MQFLEYDEAVIDSWTSEPYEKVRHHEEVLKTAKEKMQEWSLFCNREDPNSRRCNRCWCRQWQCYCDQLSEQAKIYMQGDSDINPMSVIGCEVIMYYAPKEIGRTPNTAHLFEELLPYCSSRIIFGDEMAEQKLISQMVQEHRENRVRTCIMYPTTDAELLSQWSARVHGAASSVVSGKDSSSGKDQVDDNDKDSRIRLIALDGTYSCVQRLYKHLHRSLVAALVSVDTQVPYNVTAGVIFSSQYNRPVVPVVKLDLAGGGCRSAMVGIMTQPGEEKICTYQALVLALQQLGENSQLCSSLHRHLDVWIEYILANGIKKTKSMAHIKLRAPKGLSAEQQAPADYVMKYFDIHREEEKKGVEMSEYRKSYTKNKWNSTQEKRDRRAALAAVIATSDKEAERIYDTAPISAIDCFSPLKSFLCMMSGSDDSDTEPEVQAEAQEAKAATAPRDVDVELNEEVDIMTNDGAGTDEHGNVKNDAEGRYAVAGMAVATLAVILLPVGL